MTPIRVIIAEDQAPAREHLIEATSAEPDFSLVAVTQDGRSAVDAILRHSADLVFLDVQMPEQDGFEVVRAIGPALMPPFIFVSAYDFAVRAFEVRAVDYLLKPFTSARLATAIGIARTQVLERRRAATAPTSLVEVRQRDRIVLVRPDEVESVEARRNDVLLRTATEEVRARATLSSMLAQLGRRFVRTHRSKLVNLDHVCPVLLRGSRSLLLKSGRTVAISPTFRTTIEEALRREAAGAAPLERGEA